MTPEEFERAKEFLLQSQAAHEMWLQKMEAQREKDNAQREKDSQENLEWHRRMHIRHQESMKEIQAHAELLRVHSEEIFALKDAAREFGDYLRNYEVRLRRLESF